jgi:glycosyltransferase involved in cell wall biosynthesis
MHSERDKPITFFIGSQTAANIERLLANVGAMLGEDYQLHLITTESGDLDEAVLQEFAVYGNKYNQTFIGGSRALNEYLRKKNPAMVLQMTEPSLHGLIVGLISKRYGVPAVYRYNADRFREYSELSGRRKVERFFLDNVVGRGVIHLADEHIVLGPTGEQRLINRGIEPDSISVIPPTVDIDRFENTNTDQINTEIPSSRKVVLFVGRLHKLKGTAILEEAIPEILSRRNDLHFVFLGENSHFTVPTPSEGHVTLLGHVHPDRVPSYLKWADVMIHPSLTEGLPRAVLESLAAGTPVIARDVGEIHSVTSNVFLENERFVDMVCNFEELQVDDITRFSKNAVKNKYINLINNIT